MKNLVKVFIITAGFVLYFNAKSFALEDYAYYVDFAAWGGYVFDGKTNPESYNFDGRQFGIKTHYNSYFGFIRSGIGAYYQFAKTKSDSGDILKKNSAGLDVNLIILIPVIRPYVRGTWAFMDKIENENKSFKSYGAGFGLDIILIPKYLYLFSEYMYDKSRHDIDYYSHSINVGIKFNHWSVFFTD